MEDGELDFSNHDMFSSSNLDSFLDDILKDTHACTHTHTCNPPGPDSSHTHTCFHVHTKIVPAVSESEESSEKEKKNPKKRSSGNREAVRKYREKKKARTASLEDEVVKLRALNQQLLKRLQGQAALEAEIARLKCLLVDIRGRIEGEIGSFPYQKMGNVNLGNGNLVIDPCNNVQCGDQVYCLYDGKDGSGMGVNGQVYHDSCEFDSLQCLANQSGSDLKELRGCGSGDVTANTNGCTACGNKRKAYMGMVGCLP
ncbi:basic leucine zipper 23-like isoform X2 [Punica granatum]|uniref:Basic leucine zipper 23-like isoform X2 n=1 Tax=Punica granatum TaxID=22663 RepID=A0A6P8DJU4_PUNGR|nr:basic leucine zipper 23-like isoform X2 [Punica granatum]XP_031391878.1 basic leucine zipper 23-like isoform X2 [Punica granatum]